MTEEQVRTFAKLQLSWEVPGLQWVTVSINYSFLPSTWWAGKHKDAQWEEDKSAETVRCFGWCSAGQPWLLPSMKMFLWHPAQHWCGPRQTFIEMLFPDGCGLFQHESAPWPDLQISQIHWSICGMCWTDLSNPEGPLKAKGTKSTCC